MSLSELLGRPLLTTSPALPSLQRIEAGVTRILARWPDVAPPPSDRDREALVQEMCERLASTRWVGLTVRRALMGAHAAFDRDRRERSDLEVLREFYLQEIGATDSATYLAGMMAVYLSSYMPNAAHSCALGEALASRQHEIGGRGAILLAAVASLLDPSRAHNALAARMTGMEQPFRDLKALGIAAPHAPGLMDAAHLAFVAALGGRLDDPRTLARLKNWLAPESSAPRQEGAREAIEAILRPWTHRSPPDDLRRDLAEWIVAHYQDPRVQPGGVWAGFDPSLKSVLFRWMTEADMQFFCDVVTATQNSHMWAPRRDHWLRLFRQKRIEAAWVAFCPAAADYARRHLMRSGQATVSRRFGRQVAAGGRADTSLLIMQIGRKIIVDGCHSYRTHIFDADDSKAPRLYQPDYDCDEIMRRSRNAKSHSSIPSWISWIEQST